jgi:anaerobic ribonucleoside-triphosphate reductase
MTTQTKERQKCEVYSRVVGYLSPVQRWNKGKVAEYNQRKTFDICHCTK